VSAWRRRHAVLAMLVALLAWGTGRDARADVAPAPVDLDMPIDLDLATCPSEWDPEIRLAIAVELGANDIGGHGLSVRCAEQRVWVVARNARTAATLERTLTGDLPAATAPRVIALVAVQLLTTFDPTLRRRPPETPVKPGPPAPPPVAAVQSTAAPAPVDGRRLYLTAGWVYRAFLSRGGVHAWGGVLDARRASPTGRWSAGLGLEIASAERSTNLGQTSALLASARASAGARVRLASNRLGLSFDLGARAGIVRLSGRADDPNVLTSTVVSPWAGPVATLRTDLCLSWFCAETAAEAGWAAVAVSGLVNGGPTLAASGPWLAITLGVGTRR
jgi:hypothetical protein